MHLSHFPQPSSGSKLSLWAANSRPMGRMFDTPALIQLQIIFLRSDYFFSIYVSVTCLFSIKKKKKKTQTPQKTS